MTDLCIVCGRECHNLPCPHCRASIDEMIDIEGGITPQPADTTSGARWPIGLYAPGGYSCICISCGKHHIADKRARKCADCTLQWLRAEASDAHAACMHMGDMLAARGAEVAGLVESLEWIVENNDHGYFYKEPGPFAKRAAQALAAHRALAERNEK